MGDLRVRSHLIDDDRDRTSEPNDIRWKNTIEQARDLYREWDIDGLPTELRRNNLDYYYLSVWPGLRKLRSVAGLSLPARPRSVEHAYVHIPFCSGICDFCSYFVTSTRDAGADARINGYLNRLVDQVRIHQRDIEVAVSYLYVGGGTPSLLRSDQLARLLEGMDALGAFASSLIGTMELHPELFDDPVELGRVLDVLAAHGIRRVSIGYQSQDDALLEAVNRRHRADFLSRAAACLRERGFVFNVDLMYGLPTQTLTTWVESLDAALRVRPDSISTYFTFVDHGTKLWRQAAKDPTMLVTHEHAQVCHIAAQLALDSAGYHELPNDFHAILSDDPTTFTQSNLPSAANSLAVGAGAYGYYPGVQYFNEFNFGAYARAIDEGRAPLWRAAVLTRAEELCRDIMFSFKNSPLLSVPLFVERHGVSPLDTHEQTFGELDRLHLVDVTDDAVRLTQKGRLVVEEIACLFEPRRELGAVASQVEANLVSKHNYAPTYAGDR